MIYPSKNEELKTEELQYDADNKDRTDTSSLQGPPPYSPPLHVREPIASTSRQVTQDFQPSNYPQASISAEPANRPTNHPQHVNNISIVSRQDVITGTYIINTEIPGPTPTPSLSASLVNMLVATSNHILNPETPDGAEKPKPRRLTSLVSTLTGSPIDVKRSKFFNQLPQRNAFFDVRRGSVTINLATAGYSSMPTKAFIEVSNRQGTVTVDIFSLQQGKHISMDISTRQGDTTVLLPPNYDGAVHLHYRHGALNLLPAFAQHARIVMRTDRTTLIFFGPTTSPPTQPSQDVMTDYCWASTRQGKVTVGISGVDRLST